MTMLNAKYIKKKDLSIKTAPTKAPSTLIRKFVKPQFFFYEYGLRTHVSRVFSGRIRKVLKTLTRVEIFLSDMNMYTCGRSYPQICEYAYVIFLDPVFRSSIINKHGVQQDCIFFSNWSDFSFDMMRSDKCSCDKCTQPML